MTSFARAERDRLCDTALAVGEAEPTLCGEWMVKDLIIHLLIREGSPSAIGIVVPPLAGLTELASSRLGRRDLSVLVERFRSGAPAYSPMAVPAVDKRLNTLEFFIHHEDIRRAQPGWTARVLTEREENTLWKVIRVFGKTLVRGTDGGVVIERTDATDATGRAETATLKGGDPVTTISGPPSEICLHLYGRREQALVDLT